MSHFVFRDPPNHSSSSNLNGTHQILKEQIQFLFHISNSYVHFNILTLFVPVTLDTKREYLHRALVVALAVMPLFSQKHGCNLITHAEYLSPWNVSQELK